MEDTYFAEHDDRCATAFSIADLGCEFREKRFDVLPLDISTGGVSKDEFQRALVLPLHASYGTTKKYHCATAATSDG